jgi:hypothetical protein
MKPPMAERAVYALDSLTSGYLSKTNLELIPPLLVDYCNPM